VRGLGTGLRKGKAAVLIIVERSEAGKTLAAVLKIRLGWSWSRVKRLIERRHVRVGQQIETNVARRLKRGQEIRVASVTLGGKGKGDRSGFIHSSLANPRHGSSSWRPSSQQRNSRPSSRTKQNMARQAKCDGSNKHPNVPHLAQTGSNSELTQNLSHVRTDPLGNSPGKQAERAVHDDQKPAIDVIYADEALVVVNKPAGLTTMRHTYEEAEFGERARRYLPKTLADYLPSLLGSPRRKVYAVHRLDRDTSGLVVFARTPQAARQLSEQLRSHRIERRYWAITRGIPPEGRLESWLVRDRGDGRRGSTTPKAAGAKRAVTYVQVIEKLGPFALVECRLETGRTHQVRIHLGEAGTPLCGERIYDRPLHGKPYPDASGAARPMLHACTLGFVHPITGESLLWEAPPPADFRELVERLRRSRDTIDIEMK